MRGYETVDWAAAARVAGRRRTFLAGGLDSENVQEAIDSLDCANGILIFTDMFGGTPTNVCLSFLETGRVEILAGVNLPMLVKLTNLQGSKGTLAFTRWDLYHIALGATLHGESTEFTTGAIFAFGSDDSPLTFVNRPLESSFFRLTLVLGFSFGFADAPTSQ